MADEEKEIFIDEGWKAQVQREKEAAAEAAEGPAPEAPPGQEEAGFPEPSFGALVTNLAAQAMMALGGMPGQNEGEVYVDLHQAKFAIDCLGVLQEKTQGNLDEEETAQINEAVTELSKAFDMLVQQFEAQSQREAGFDPPNLTLQ